MAATYDLISSSTLSSNQAIVTLNSFSGYTDLVLKVQFELTATGNCLFTTFNGETQSANSANYAFNTLSADGTTMSANYRTTNSAFGLWKVGTGSGKGNMIIYNFMNYSNTTGWKSCLVRSGGTSQVELLTGTWKSTSAITSIRLESTGSASFVSGSVFNLYGIKAV